MSYSNGPASSHQGMRYEPVPKLGGAPDAAMQRRWAKQKRILNRKKKWLRESAPDHTLAQIAKQCKWTELTAKTWLRRLNLPCKDFEPKGRWPDDHKSKSKHPLFNTYYAMIDRCTNPNYIQWKDYGGRGITVCQRWRDDFWAFVEDVGERPSDDLSLGRIDNDGNYEPGNVEWQTSTEQNRNRRNVRLITIDGKTKCLTEWCHHYGISYQTVASRLRRGLTELEALTQPVRGRKAR